MLAAPPQALPSADGLTLLGRLSEQQQRMVAQGSLAGPPRGLPPETVSALGPGNSSVQTPAPAPTPASVAVAAGGCPRRPAPPPPSAEEAERSRKRHRVVQELVETERRFLDGLLVLQQIQEQVAGGKVEGCRPHLARQIFSAVPLLVGVHRVLLERLESLHSGGAAAGVEQHLDPGSSSRPNPRSIAECFADGQLMGILKMYGPYIDNYDRALDALGRLPPRVRQRLDAMAGAATADSGSGRQSVQSLLVTPVQRIPRYGLLLRELRKWTAATENSPSPSPGSQEEEYRLLGLALERVAGLARELDHRRLEYLRKQRLLRLVAMLGDRVGGPLIEPSRRWVAQSPGGWTMASLGGPDEGSGPAASPAPGSAEEIRDAQGRPCTLHLLSDLLLVTRRSRRQRSSLGLFNLGLPSSSVLEGGSGGAGDLSFDGSPPDLHQLVLRIRLADIRDAEVIRGGSHGDLASSSGSSSSSAAAAAGGSPRSPPLVASRSSGGLFQRRRRSLSLSGISLLTGAGSRASTASAAEANQAGNGGSPELSASASFTQDLAGLAARPPPPPRPEDQQDDDASPPLPPVSPRDSSRGPGGSGQRGLPSGADWAVLRLDLDPGASASLSSSSGGPASPRRGLRFLWTPAAAASEFCNLLLEAAGACRGSPWSSASTAAAAMSSVASPRGSRLPSLPPPQHPLLGPSPGGGRPASGPSPRHRHHHSVDVFGGTDHARSPLAAAAPESSPPRPPRDTRAWRRPVPRAPSGPRPPPGPTALPPPPPPPPNPVSPEPQGPSSSPPSPSSAAERHPRSPPPPLPLPGRRLQTPLVAAAGHEGRVPSEDKGDDGAGSPSPAEPPAPDTPDGSDESEAEAEAVAVATETAAPGPPADRQGGSDRPPGKAGLGPRFLGLPAGRLELDPSSRAAGGPRPEHKELLLLAVPQAVPVSPQASTPPPECAAGTPGLFEGAFGGPAPPSLDGLPLVASDETPSQPQTQAPAPGPAPAQGEAQPRLVPPPSPPQAGQQRLVLLGAVLGLLLGLWLAGFLGAG